MNELHTKILDAARDEVAKEQLHPDWESLISWTIENNTSVRDISVFIQAYSQIVGEKAMDRQFDFMLWTFWMDWIYSDGRFMNSKSGDVVSDLELYAIWREGK